MAKTLIGVSTLLVIVVIGVLTAMYFYRAHNRMAENRRELRQLRAENRQLRNVRREISAAVSVMWGSEDLLAERIRTVLERTDMERTDKERQLP